MHLGAVREASAFLAAVLPDERDEEALDEHEDRDDEDRDEEVALPDPVRVRRLRRYGRKLREEAGEVEAEAPAAIL